MDQEALQRIARAEDALARGAASLEALRRALDAMEALEQDLPALFRYYGSEDAVYDALQELREEAFRMLSLAAGILRDWI